jgi:hypothetical protein
MPRPVHVKHIGTEEATLYFLLPIIDTRTYAIIQLSKIEIYRERQNYRALARLMTTFCFIWHAIVIRNLQMLKRQSNIVQPKVLELISKINENRDSEHESRNEEMPPRR